MSTPKDAQMLNLTQEELNARINEAVKAKFDAIHTNKVVLACTVKDKNIKEGADKIVNGEFVGKYDDTYHIEFTFQGGAFTHKVKKEHYNALQVGVNYLCSGYVSVENINTAYKDSSYQKAYVLVNFVNFEVIQ